MAVEETAEAPEQSTEQKTDEPDFKEQFSVLDEKLDKVLAAREEPEPQYAPEDLYYGTEPEYEEEDEYVEEEPQYEYQQPEDPRLEALTEWAIQQENEKRVTSLRGLAEKYEDFTERVPDIADAMDEVGIEDPRLREALAERFYLSMKAQDESSAETPAEEARSKGARLETGASAGATPTEEDPDAEFKRAFRDLMKEDDVLG